MFLPMSCTSPLTVANRTVPANRSCHFKNHISFILKHQIHQIHLIDIGFLIVSLLFMKYWKVDYYLKRMNQTKQKRARLRVTIELIINTLKKRIASVIKINQLNLRMMETWRFDLHFRSIARQKLLAHLDVLSPWTAPNGPQLSSSHELIWSPNHKSYSKLSLEVKGE